MTWIAVQSPAPSVCAESIETQISEADART